MTKEQREKRVSDENIKNYFDEKEWQAEHHINVEDIPATDNVETEVFKHDMQQKIQTLMDSLLPYQKKAAIMFFFENKSYAEIGEALWYARRKKTCSEHGQLLVESALRHMRNPRLTDDLHDYIEQ